MNTHIVFSIKKSSYDSVIQFFSDGKHSIVDYLLSLSAIQKDVFSQENAVSYQTNTANSVARGKIELSDGEHIDFDFNCQGSLPQIDGFSVSPEICEESAVVLTENFIYLDSVFLYNFTGYNSDFNMGIVRNKSRLINHIKRSFHEDMSVKLIKTHEVVNPTIFFFSVSLKNLITMTDSDVLDFLKDFTLKLDGMHFICELSDDSLVLFQQKKNSICVTNPYYYEKHDEIENHEIRRCIAESMGLQYNGKVNFLKVIRE